MKVIKLNEFEALVVSEHMYIEICDMMEDSIFPIGFGFRFHDFIRESSKICQIRYKFPEGATASDVQTYKDIMLIYFNKLISFIADDSQHIFDCAKEIPQFTELK